MFDADEGGERCTQECIERLSPQLFVKTVDIKPSAKKPHQLTAEQLKEII